MNVFTLTNLAEKVRGRNNPAPPSIRDAPAAGQYRAVAAAIETNLHEHILAMWFPRAVNHEHGGFDQNFSRNWTGHKDKRRSIVYQARLTWLASQAALHDCRQSEYWLGFARHGFAFLDNALRDREDGGFFWALDAGGAPVHDGEKHIYGHAFAVFALSAYYRATGEEYALELAQSTFRWMADNTHDDANGGYHEALSRSGRPLTAPFHPERRTDLIGTRYGCKSTNSHLHLLEAYSALFQIWPDARVAAHLRELLLLLREKFILPSGTMPEFFTPDWNAVSGFYSFGHDIEAAFLLLEAGAAIGALQDDAIWTQARTLADHTLEFGWDAHYGGCFECCDASGVVQSDRKIWWVQAEACNTLLLLHEKFGAKTLRYWNAFIQQWDFIRTRQTDREHGGWHRVLSRRGAALRGEPKSDAWTDGYHQGRALMNISSRLQQMAYDCDLRDGQASAATPSACGGL